MLQRLPIVSARVKLGNTSKKLLHEIRKWIYYEYEASIVYNNIMNSIDL